MKLAALQSDFKRCNIQPDIYVIPFISWPKIPKNLKGLYSIWENDRCIYVGKTGRNIAIRMFHHNNKARGLFECGTRDTPGWRLGRSRPDWSPDTWTIEYFTCLSAKARTYLEGAMVLLFNPECNDESIQDRLLNEGTT